MIVILNLTETAQLNPDFSLSGHTYNHQHFPRGDNQ